jgi:hypothetical protein
VGQKSEVANPNEPDGQHMQEEAAQELMHTQSHETLFVAVPRIPPTKRHTMIFQRRQAVTGYGHAMRVSAQVVHHMLRPAKRTFSRTRPSLSGERFASTQQKYADF